MLAAGMLLEGRYRIERPLGRGGMGSVWLARHVLLGEPVAIKVLDRPGDRGARARLVREARSAARLRSDYVVRVIDVFELPAEASVAPANPPPAPSLDRAGEVALVQEYVDGATLAEERARRGSLPIAEAVLIALQLLCGLSEAHRLGIVHRDLKPQNVLLAILPDGRTRPRLIDFGVAKTAGASALTADRTVEGALLGSPLYMAPEQIADPRAVDARADLWSLGIVLFELLTGKLPFSALTTAGLLARIERDEPASLTDLCPLVPAPLAGVVARLLAKDPADRFPDAAAVAEALAPFADGGAALAAEARAIAMMPPPARGPDPTEPSPEDPSLDGDTQAPSGPQGGVTTLSTAAGTTATPRLAEVLPGSAPGDRSRLGALAWGAVLAGVLGAAWAVRPFGAQSSSPSPARAAPDPSAPLVSDATIPDPGSPESPVAPLRTESASPAPAAVSLGSSSSQRTFPDRGAGAPAAGEPMVRKTVGTGAGPKPSGVSGAPTAPIVTDAGAPRPAVGLDAFGGRQLGPAGKEVPQRASRPKRERRPRSEHRMPTLVG